eukprot:15462191-Alexandrium_andersonii.AAC.1
MAWPSPWMCLEAVSTWVRCGPGQPARKHWPSRRGERAWRQGREGNSDSVCVCACARQACVHEHAHVRVHAH